MGALDKIENKLDKIIYKNITKMKIEAVADIIYFCNSKKNLDNYELDISVHEKSIRRDYHYDPERSFESLYAQIIVNDDEKIEFKDFVKELFTFAMTYKPLEVENVFNLNIQNEIYDCNNLLNEIVHSDFFENAGKKTPKKIFKEIVNLLEQKGEDKNNYLYVEPYNLTQKQLISETAQEQAILNRQQLFEALNNFTPTNNPRKKI